MSVNKAETKVKIFFGKPSSVESELNQFFSNKKIKVINMLQSESATASACYIPGGYHYGITITVVYTE